MMGSDTMAERYRRQAEESIALAKTAIRNEVRALHYAMAEQYLRLAENETKSEAKPAA
jgi:HEPN domain-containing protein